jgi:hypothetical protein
MELALDKAVIAHKAFLLSLIQSGKIANENMIKILNEFKCASGDFEPECIYCKYSQFAFKESAKAGIIA